MRKFRNRINELGNLKNQLRIEFEINEIMAK